MAVLTQENHHAADDDVGNVQELDFMGATVIVPLAPAIESKDLVTRVVIRGVVDIGGLGVMNRGDGAMVFSGVTLAPRFQEGVPAFKQISRQFRGSFP